MAWVSLLAVALLAGTGALDALADTLYPVHSLTAGFAQDLKPDANIVVELRTLHPILASAVGLWLIYYAICRAPATGRLAQGLIATAVAQLLAGVVNLVLLVLLECNSFIC